MGHDRPVNRLSLPVRQDIVDDEFPVDHNGHGSVIVPKYSNYLHNQQKWARAITARIPIELLNIQQVKKGSYS